MTNTLTSLFPSTLRLNRQKNKFDKLILIISILFFVSFTLYNCFYLNMLIIQAIWEAFRKVSVLYITYLIMIELAPDNPNIYLLSYFVIGLSLVLFYRVFVFATLFFLFNIRILTKSSGYKSSVIELSFMMIFTVMEYFFSPFLYPLLFAIVLLLDFKFKNADNTNIPFIVISILMSLLWINSGFSLMEANLSIFSSILVIIVGIAYILRLSLIKSILSFNDLESNYISPKRVKASGLVLLVSLIILAIAHATVTEFIHLWVMLACISLPFLKDLKHVING